MKTVTYKIGASILVAALPLFLAGCANDTPSSSLSLSSATAVDTVSSKQTSADATLDLKKNYDVALLNQSPKVLIAKQREKTIVRAKRRGPSLDLFGDAQQNGPDGDTQKTRTVSRTPKTYEAGIDGQIRGGYSGGNDGGYAEVSEQKTVFPDVVTPVASTAYGSDVVVIKSVNGGFGMVLMKQGVDQNFGACNAFFNALPGRSLSNIEKAAVEGKGLFRPTYWLDRREEKKLDYRKKFQVASIAPTYLSYLHKEVVVSGKGGQDLFNCSSKVRHYNYAVSHALLRRLGLLERRGPFLAAWRDDGGKAMVLDMSEFDTDLDFKEALETWMAMIVREPRLWTSGVHGASFKQRLRRLLNKGGKSVLSLLVPTTVSANTLR